MSTPKTFWLISSALVATCLLAAPPQPARARTATESPDAASQPPAVAGRLAFIQGTVSFRTADQQQWQPASLNYPLTGGDALWTEPQALAEIQIAASSVWMNGGTELDVNTLDERTLAATEPQGELYLHLRNLPEGQSYAVTTPRGVVMLTKDGRYDIVAGDTEHPTTVTVVDGAAQVTGDSQALQVGPDQTATINGTETFHGSVGALAQDAFLASMEAREQRQTALKASASSAPTIVSGMTGCQSLQSYGSWASNPQYGAVWYPQVGSDWTPYSDGAWDYVAPWGWTWVGAEPWGFAPFHYGRWAEIHGRWAWVPGAYAEGSATELAVYAPALVTFFKLGSDQLGWVPLAPGEAYYPPYRADERYLRAVNRFDVRDAAALRGDERREEPGLERLANRRAAIVGPENVMTESRMVRDAAHRLGDEHLAEAQPLIGREPVKPTLATAGLTPRIAREQHLEGGARRIALAPGPRIETTEHGAIARGEHQLPALRQANIPAAPPGEPRRAGEAERRPGEALPGGLPALRAPSARPGAPVAVIPGTEPTPREPGAPVAGVPGSPSGAVTGPELRREERQRGGPSELPAEAERPRHEVLIQPGLRPPAPPVVIRPVVPHATAPRFAPPPRGRAAPISVRPAVPSPLRFAPPRAYFAPPAAHFAPPAMHFAPAIHVAAPAPRPLPPRGGRPPGGPERP